MAATLPWWLNLPEYFYQPAVTLRRAIGVVRGHRGSPGDVAVIQLPWKLRLEVDRGEAIGRALSHHGLFEMAVVETIFRLLDPGEYFLDVGANIGFMSAAALAAGAGEILAFEPHPALYARLSRNMSLWSESHPELASRLHHEPLALSDRKGSASLNVPSRDFRGNQGTSSLEPNPQRQTATSIEIQTTTLDDVVGTRSVGVLKIDIEGHEWTTFHGGERVLKAQQIRDIVFEDQEGIESRVCSLLRGHGYTIFGVNKTLLGPVLLDRQGVDRFRQISNENLNFLATVDPSRALLRMRTRFYRCLSHSTLH